MWVSFTQEYFINTFPKLWPKTEGGSNAREIMVNSTILSATYNSRPQIMTIS